MENVNAIVKNLKRINENLIRTLCNQFVQQPYIYELCSDTLNKSFSGQQPTEILKQFSPSFSINDKFMYIDRQTGLFNSIGSLWELVDINKFAEYILNNEDVLLTYCDFILTTDEIDLYIYPMEELDYQLEGLQPSTILENAENVDVDDKYLVVAFGDKLFSSNDIREILYAFSLDYVIC